VLKKEKKMNHQKWLFQEMEQWRREGIIDGAMHGTLQQRYAADGSSVSWRQIVLCSLGALLIGIGVIALLAANWDVLSRPMRALLALLPLTLCVGAYLQGLRKGWRSIGLFEPLGIFWAISVGAGLALIAQTYQISGDEEAFALAWTLMLLPTLYATRSVSVGVGYFIGLFVWACLASDNGNVRMAYWLLACLAIPFIVSLRKESPGGIRAGLMMWGVVLCSTAAVGVTIGEDLTLLWVLIYSGAFASLLLGGILCEPKNVSIWQTPMRTFGAFGLAVLLYLLTFEFPWEEICRGSFYRLELTSSWGVLSIGSALVFLTPALSIVLLVIAYCKKQSGITSILVRALVGFAPILIVILCRIVSANTNYEDAAERAGTTAMWVTVYLACLGIATIVNGIVRSKMLYVNGGVLIVLGLILGKFFTSEFSFTVKGIAFIVCGCLFFAVNMLASRQMKKAGGAQ
jgi:uncharacterized membrane protein